MNLAEPHRDRVDPPRSDPMMKFRAICLALPLLLASLPAGASPLDSPEEAVAELMFGISNGTDARLDGEQNWRRLSSSPAVFAAGTQRLTIERLDACRYAVRRESISAGAAPRPFRATIDMSRISAWRAVDNEGVVEGDGLCIHTYRNACPARSFAFQTPDGGGRPHEEAFATLKAACSGG